MACESDQRIIDTHVRDVAIAAIAGAGHGRIETQCTSARPELFAQLKHFHRIRQFAMEGRKQSDLRLGALLRESLGWSLSKPKEERDIIAEHALALIATGEKLLKWQVIVAEKPATKRKPPDTSDPAFMEWQDVIMASLASRDPMAKTEDKATEQMETLAGELPVAAWWRANVFKGSLVSLAVLIAETGDLSNYATVSKVWKRMGVAVMDGVRQGGLTKSAPKAEWIAHGYVRRRRSLLFVIGDTLIKQNEHYRGVYLKEKDRQRAIAEAKGLKVVPSAKIPKAHAAEFMSDGHVHNRARRYMEKQLLLDLWVEWRAAKVLMNPIAQLPPEPNSEAA